MTHPVDALRKTGTTVGAFADRPSGLVDRLDGLIDQFKSDLIRRNPDILVSHPIEDYLDNVVRSVFMRPNSYYTPRLKARMAGLGRRYGKAVEALYHKTAFACLMKKALAQPLQRILPPEIHAETLGWFDRICADFQKLPDAYYSMDDFSFRVDLGVCSLKCLPVGGAWIVEHRRIGLRPLWTPDVGLVLKILRYLAFETRGVSPFLVIHTFPRYTFRFNRGNMDAAYRRMGELFDRNPRLKGIYRRSWFLDPHLEAISPELAYLRQTPQQHGALVYRAHTNAGDHRKALALSAKRRRLHAQGDYIPRAYAFIWPRKAFLRWHADRFA